ncbi:MAG: glycosyltransferase [Anaerolineae bacterium]
MSILVPARDEARHIGPCVRSLLAQDYGAFEVIALDDGSTDGTGAILGALAQSDPRLRVLGGAAPPDGWTGKNWACHQLARRPAASSCLHGRRHPARSARPGRRRRGAAGDGRGPRERPAPPGAADVGRAPDRPDPAVEPVLRLPGSPGRPPALAPAGDGRRPGHALSAPRRTGGSAAMRPCARTWPRTSRSPSGWRRRAGGCGS